MGSSSTALTTEKSYRCDHADVPVTFFARTPTLNFPRPRSMVGVNDVPVMTTLSRTTVFSRSRLTVISYPLAPATVAQVKVGRSFGVVAPGPVIVGAMGVDGDCASRSGRTNTLGLVPSLPRKYGIPITSSDRRSPFESPRNVIELASSEDPGRNDWPSI